MNNKEKVAIVLLTYNRKKLLQKCLEGVLKQTKLANRIFLVDNACTDGTEEMFHENFINDDSIFYLKIHKNIGAAGGFYEGVKAAYEWGADWIWFLDDDIVPRSNCLEKMLEYKHISKCIHPTEIDINNNVVAWEAVFDPSVGRVTFFLENISFKNGKDFTFFNIGCFEGMLIHREIVSKIGFPDKRFFMWGVDEIYGFIASLYTNVIYVRDAMIDKQIAFQSNVSPFFAYYAIRNRFLVKEYLKKYNIFNAKWFYLNMIIYFFSISVKQAIKSRNFKVTISAFKGLFDGVRHKFYK